jgi:hypothetical protein
MTLARSSIVALLACLLSACAATGAIETSGDTSKFVPFRSFHIQDEQYAFATEISDEQRRKVSAQLRAAAVSAFRNRGYVEAANADVLVVLAAISRPTLSTESEPSGGLHHVNTSVLDSSQPFNPPEPPPSGVGREGDLMLSLLDPKTQRVVWQASSNGAATTPAEALRNARATYAAMIARLPKAGGSAQ